MAIIKKFRIKSFKNKFSIIQFENVSLAYGNRLILDNINFTINAVDAAGVEQLLTEQRGNIIGMIREAANDTGEYFLEQVDTQSMGGSGGGYG